MTVNKDFKTEEDAKRRNRLLGIAYGSYLPFVFLAQTLLSPLEYAVKFAVVSVISVLPEFLGGARAKGFLSGLFNQKTLFKDLLPAPTCITEDIKELSLKAGISEKIETYVSSDVDKYGSVACRDRIYVGKKLTENLDRAELKAILAHEIAHIKTEDSTEDVLFKPAKHNVFADMLISATSLVAGAEAAGLKGIAAPLLTLLLTSIFYEFQDALCKENQRDHEYRADRNALKLTDDFYSAVRAFVKMNPAHCLEAPWRERISSTHPRGIARLRAMERAANKGRETHLCNAIFKMASALPVDIRTAPNPEILVDVAWVLTEGGEKEADLKAVSFVRRSGIS